MKKDEPMEHQKLFSIHEQSTRYSIGESSIRDALKAGDLRGYFFGGAGGWKIEDVDMDEWLNSKANRERVKP